MEKQPEENKIPASFKPPKYKLGESPSFGAGLQSRRVVQTVEDPWKVRIDEYIRSNPEFIFRAKKCSLIPEDVTVICEALELSGTSGMTLDVFAAKLRLIESEMALLKNSHPEIANSLKIAAANKKGALLEVLMSSSVRSSKAAQDLLTNPELSKSQTERQEDEIESRGALEKVLSKLLTSNRPAPTDFCKIVYIDGFKNKNETKQSFEKSAGYQDVTTVLEKLEGNKL